MSFLLTSDQLQVGSTPATLDMASKVQRYVQAFTNRLYLYVCVHCLIAFLQTYKLVPVDGVFSIFFSFFRVNEWIKTNPIKK